ncbi:Expansin-b3 [Thalictrum thalictroides]|uniref:Expansin-b3 n=1 Tax=Thalictrum thalictroides TaxID=46969 RepID=A0A7J6WWB3_THATH|nr:Expansin-b3 [Thalictrum thalictroides]
MFIIIIPATSLVPQLTQQQRWKPATATWYGSADGDGSTGSTEFWLSLLVEYEDGDGDIGAMHIQQANSNEWQEMKHLWGANWCVITGAPLKGPFSVKLTTLSTKRSLSARGVIPSNWSVKATYTSRLNF